MTPLAPLVTKFLGVHLREDKGVSPNTIVSYGDSFRLFFRFIAKTLGKPPTQLALEELDAGTVRKFLVHLEKERGCSSRTRNLRLTAIRSFMRFVEFEVPAALEQVTRVLAIPVKRAPKKLVGHLDLEEARAVLASPSTTSRLDIRDRVLLALGVHGGLRSQEILGLRLDQLRLDAPIPEILVEGKGRKQRRVPLPAKVVSLMERWLANRGEAPVPYVFLNAQGRKLSRSGLRYIVKKHTSTAAEELPRLARKNVTPHTLRHTCAIHTLEATGDLRHVALLLGHATIRSTEIYLRADPQETLEAIQAVLPPEQRSGAFAVEDDPLMREILRLCRAAEGPDPSWSPDHAGHST